MVTNLPHDLALSSVPVPPVPPFHKHLLLLLLDKCKGGQMGSVATLDLSFFIYTAVLGSNYENELNMPWVLESTLQLSDND